MKKLVSILLCFTLFATFPVVAFADDSEALSITNLIYEEPSSSPRETMYGEQLSYREGDKITAELSDGNVVTFVCTSDGIWNYSSTQPVAYATASVNYGKPGVGSSFYNVQVGDVVDGCRAYIRVVIDKNPYDSTYDITYDDKYDFSTKIIDCPYRVRIGDVVYEKKSDNTVKAYGTSDIGVPTGNLVFSDYVEFCDGSRYDQYVVSGFTSVLNLTSVTLSSAVTRIEDACFMNTNMMELYIPSSVTYIGPYAVGYTNQDLKKAGFTIYGVSGSAAEEYANENGIKFVADETPADVSIVSTEFIGSDLARETEYGTPFSALYGDKVVVELSDGNTVTFTHYNGNDDEWTLTSTGEVSSSSYIHATYGRTGHNKTFYDVEVGDAVNDCYIDYWGLVNGKTFSGHQDLTTVITDCGYRKRINDIVYEIVGDAAWAYAYSEVSDFSGDIQFPEYIDFYSGDNAKRVNMITLEQFSNLPALTSITIPDNVGTIMNDCFVNTGLTEITIPETVGIIYSHALGFTKNEKGEYSKVEGFTIHGVSGSAAEQYANENGFTFVPIDSGDNDIASGELDGLNWRITSKGELIIGNQGETHYLDKPDGVFPWRDYAEKIRTARFGGNVIGKNLCTLFYDCQNMTSVDLTGLDTSQATNMNCMFGTCLSLTDLDLSGFDTSNVTDFGGMFAGCNSLTKLDLSSFNTSNATDIGVMFANCGALTKLDLSGFDTSKVLYMDAMFRECPSLTEVVLSRFDTSKVTNMNSMFRYCPSLTKLDLSSFDTSNVSEMKNMFEGCSALVKLDLSGFDMRKVTAADDMLSLCSSLKTINTPKNMTLDTGLPITMYDSEGKEYSYLPRSLAVSIKLYDEAPDPGDNPEPPAPEPVSIAGASVTNIVTKTRTGKAITQSPVVKLKGVTLKNGVDYTLSYKNNINASIAAYVIITGKGGYTGSITRKFTIQPLVPALNLKSVTKGSKSFTAKWPKASTAVQKQFTGYQIQYSTRKNFTTGTKVKSTTQKSAKKVIIRKLKKKKNYYVRIRRYLKWNGQMIYSNWSAVKTVKTK